MENRRIKNFINELQNSKSTIFSIIFLIFIVFISVFVFLIPINPDATDTANMLQSPSLSHLFGTDELGRDYLTRTIYGGRVSLIVGVLAMIISTSIGVLVGTISGYFGGKTDNILMRFVDIISSIPWLILVTVISIFLKPGLQAIIIVIGLFTWMEIARLVRAETLSIKEREYVLYAISIGQSSKKIIFKHIIPSVFPTIIIASTTSIADAIMTESSLSFLGLGIQQPMSSWGNLLQNAQANLQSAAYMAILPGVLIILTIYSFNKLGNTLRVIVEPKTAGGER
ncbi:ABC transporter permease [Clostridium saccharoperbutylacetonicum]|uniref:Oligopeptide transport system permease protein OppC n=1 Tax=Clostridium saccharoperbutylacetonicum N1-4(HMT) TaxID=931276 RepID=M1LQL0_9CLOT|nr:ABC transporter permease [Clostridium saccharoperbutylacetonicum]AGF55160.1 oligopeptide transport system permease protein OppC [Clostridium saccharoperbutylacetonicum N1-4(HMT)]AQR94051.1 oligopeptide transport system permease protein OppC [Clostridium saccharoperbutylacetonicum]NRT64129.1 peptide/nickel transport system permease protein [Clostridium saccharoperbutylacetonicum]NSB27496.1 peptide/nickel transport system permease protein [Clostridium saccharoperbutylacetonicum]NSB29750.1 pep